MAVLNFPQNPTLNQVYSFHGKTWIWNGQGWALDKSGAINGVVIGNIVPEEGTFTTLTANALITDTFSVAGVLTGNGIVSSTFVSATGNVVGGNIVTNGNVLTNSVQSNTISVTGTANVGGLTSTGNITTTGNVAANNIDATGNVTAPYFFGNVVGNISGNLVVPGANTEVIFNDNGQAGASPGLTFRKTANVLSVTGNVVATNFNGSGVGLTSTMSDKGSDPNNWNTLMEMGTYTVNRVNWGGVTGPPIDSLVYVGLLTVSSSNTVPGVLAVQQVFSPGIIDPVNAKLQWVRNYWSGSWTPWLKIVNDAQNIDGGSF